MHWTIKRAASAMPIRRTIIPLFRRVNLGDVTITHHWTGERIVVHSFRHKGYWFHGREREKESMTLCARLIRPGDVVFDVGGHIGYMALYFGDLTGAGGRVFAFEPSPVNLPYIRRNVERAGHKNVILREHGIGAENGRTSFWAEDLCGQNGSLVPGYSAVRSNAASHGVKARIREISIDVVTLDSAVESIGAAPKFVKIDVEGAESLVLRGMQDTLRAARPRIMAEVTCETENVFETLMAADYLLFDEKGLALRRPSDFAGGGCNLFAIPAEDHEALLEVRGHE